MVSLAIVGAGGHSKVVADAVIAIGGFELLGFFDDDESLQRSKILGFPVLGNIASWCDQKVDRLLPGIGSNRVRREIVMRETGRGAAWETIVHPAATVSRSATIGSSTVVLAGAIINADAIIHDDAIINTGSIIEHDCVVGSHVHIAPGCCLAGNVSIGEGTFLGIGSLVLPGIRIGNWCTIGAGAVVTRDVESGRIVAGVPARVRQ